MSQLSLHEKLIHQVFLRQGTENCKDSGPLLVERIPNEKVFFSYEDLP